MQRIWTVDAANAFMPAFDDDYNQGRRSGREYRKVTESLTLRYERKMYLIQDAPSNQRLIGKYIEVFQFPDGRIEIRVAGESLPYSTYGKLG